MKLKITQPVLLIAALFLSFPAQAYDCVIDGIYYDLNPVEKTASVTNGSEKYIGNVIIPEEITYESISYVVTTISPHAFEGCIDLSSVTIPNSVTTIGFDAFQGCSGLTSVTIPGSVTNIGSNPFSSCWRMTNIVVEKDNPKYDSRENCNAIIETATNKLISACKSTIIPNTVTAIGGKAFYYCIDLTSVKIPDFVTTIGEKAFCGCFELTNVNIPNSVTEICDYAFEYCSSLTNIEIPNSVTEIGDSSFGYCQGITSVTIPNSVTMVGSAAFRECTSLTSVIFNAEKCTFVGTQLYPAFSGCDNLTIVTI